MTSADIALVRGLNFQAGCSDRLCVNSDFDETRVSGMAEVSEVLAHHHYIQTK